MGEFVVCDVDMHGAKMGENVKERMLRDALGAINERTIVFFVDAFDELRQQIGLCGGVDVPFVLGCVVVNRRDCNLGSGCVAQGWWIARIDGWHKVGSIGTNGLFDWAQYKVSVAQESVASERWYSLGVGEELHVEDVESPEVELVMFGEDGIHHGWEGDRGHHGVIFLSNVEIQARTRDEHYL